MVLPVPKHKYLNMNLDGPLWRISKIQKNEQVFFDFSGVDFLRPETVLMLVFLSNYVVDKTELSVKWINMSTDIFSFIERIDIAHIPSIILVEPKKQFSFWNRSTAPSLSLIELQIIKSPQDGTKIVAQTKEIMKKWLTDTEDSSYLQSLPVLISEIANNSIEHSSFSNDGICYYLLQKYNYGENGVEIVIVLGDMGKGIRNSYTEYNEWLLETSDLRAIRKAFDEGVSSRPDGSGGLGLQTVKETLSALKGEIAIRSGQAVLSYNFKEDKYFKKEFNRPFPGTQTVFILKNT